MSEQIITKRCPRCKEIKSLSEFYKCRTTKDGHQSYCKICLTKRNTERDQSQKGKAMRKRYRESKKGREVQKCAQRKYRQSQHGKEKRKSSRETKKYKIWEKQYNLKHNERVQAKNAVAHAIRTGKLIRPDSLQCSFCPKTAKQYHHHKGYEPEHWLDVVPVCFYCHSHIPKS